MHASQGTSVSDALLAILSDPAKTKQELERLEGIRTDAETAIAKAEAARKDVIKEQAHLDSLRSTFEANKAASKRLMDEGVKVLQEKEADLIRREEALSAERRAVEAKIASMNDAESAIDAKAAEVNERMQDLREKENRLAETSKRLEQQEVELKNKFDQLRQLAG